MARCPACKEKVSKKDTFCPKCGCILDFDSKRVSVNATSVNATSYNHYSDSHNHIPFDPKNMPHFDHIPDPRYSRPTTRKQTKNSMLVPIIISIVTLVIVLLSVVGYTFFTEIDFNLDASPYMETTVEDLYDDYPEYIDQLKKMEVFIEEIESIYSQYPVEMEEIRYYVDADDPIIDASIHIYPESQGSISIYYYAIKEEYSLNLWAEESGETLEDVRISFQDYPLFMDLLDYLNFDQDYYENALLNYDPRVPLEHQTLSYEQHFDDCVQQCSVRFIEDYFSKEYSMMIDYYHYNY